MLRVLSLRSAVLTLLVVTCVCGPNRSLANPPDPCGSAPLWSTTVGAPVTAAAAFSSEFGPDLTFVAAGATVTAHHNGTGLVAWTRTLAGAIVGSPVPTLLRNGFMGVFVTVANGDVVRLDINTGAVQWTQNLRRAGSPTDGLAATPAIQRWDLSNNAFQIGVSTDLVFVATRYTAAPANQNRFYALRADTGVPFWTFNNPVAFPIDLAIEGGTVDYALNRAYFGTGVGGGAQPTTWAINTITGAQAWAVPAGAMQARPTLRGNRLYMANTQGQVIAMNTQMNGVPFWNAPVTTTQFVGTPYAETRPPFDQYLVLRGANGTLFALRDQGPAPVPAWSTNFGVGAGSSATGAGDPGLLYVGLNDGLAAEVDLIEGTIRDVRPIGGVPVVAAPAVDRDSGGPGEHELVAAAGTGVQRFCLPFVNPLLSRDQAIDIALCTVIDPSPLDSVLVGFLFQRTGPDSVLYPGQIVTDWDSTFTKIIDDETYLIWLDLDPNTFWEHPSQFVFMDARTGALEFHESLSWPVVDGVQQNQLTFDGNSSPDKIHGNYTGTSTSYSYTPVSRPNQDGWGLVITGMNLVTGGATPDGPAIGGDANRAVEILNGVEKGPKLPPGNITVVNTGGGGNTGATNDEICTAIENLPRNCAKLHVYYVGHGSTDKGGSMVTRGANGKPDRLPWSKLRDKLLETGAKEVCIVLMACYSGTAVDDINKALNPPGGKGPKIQLKGKLTTSSSAGQPTDREPDGSTFMKALLACWKDCAADLDNDHKINQCEAQAWAIANNATVAGRTPQGQTLGGCAVKFPPPETKTVSSSADGGGSVNFEITLVYYRGEGKQVACRGTLYVNNTSGSPHRATKSVQIICKDAKGKPIGAPIVLGPDKLSLDRKQRRCIQPLDPACRSIEVKKVSKPGERDIRPLATVVPNGRAATEHRSAYFRAGEFAHEEFKAVGTTGQTIETLLTPLPGWNLTIDPALPLTLPSYMDTVEVIFRATVPDTATQGARFRGLVRNLTTQDSLCLELRALLYDSLDVTIGAGQTHALKHIEAYGGLSVAGGTARLLDGIVEMRANTPCSVLPGGALELRDMAFEPGPSATYTLDVHGALDWESSTLVAPGNGLRLFSPPATVHAGGVFNSSGDGVFATGNMDSLSFDFFVIDSTAANGLVLDAVTNCLMGNVSISNSGLQDVVLRNNAIAELRDCTFDPGKLDVQAGSTLTRSWSTNLVVTTSDDDPIPGVPIRIIDALGDTVASGLTGDFGFFSQALVSAVHAGAVVTAHTPHQIRITAAGVDTTIAFGAITDSTLVIELPIPTSGVEPPPPPVQLAQNVPNPFLRETTISYRLAEPGHVRLQLFDPRGRAVRLLVDRPQEAGAHSVILPAEGLTPGIYFYRLQCGPTIKSRKLVLGG